MTVGNDYLAAVIVFLNNYYMKTHGDTKGIQRHYLYTLWASIKTRCYNTNYHTYKHYGGRGIIMFEPWVNDYIMFKDWILTNLGERPKGFSLDRINNNGFYTPNNLRWANQSVQVSNRRHKYSVGTIKYVKLLLIKGLLHKDISIITGVSKAYISDINNNKDKLSYLIDAPF